MKGEYDLGFLPANAKTKENKLRAMLDGIVETHTDECPGCRKKDNSRHTGTCCKVMDWNSAEPVEFRKIPDNGGVHGK